MDFDLFGRHVNRASRVEGLARGGQIYMTYPVFDSAKGWLESQGGKQLVWKKHGRYFLKGIKEAVEIYEVADSAIQNPKPPANARKKTGLPSWVVMVLLVLAGVIASFGVKYFQRTEVWLVDFYPKQALFNRTHKPLVLEESKDKSPRKLADPVPAGQYLIYYKVAKGVRFFGPLEVKRGENRIKVDFKEYRLPAKSARISLTPENGDTDQVNFSKEYTYTLFDAVNQPHDMACTLSFTLDGRPAGEVPDQYAFTIKWQLNLNQKMVADGSKTLTSIKSDGKRHRFDTVIFKDDIHQFELNFTTIRNHAQVDISGVFL